MSTQDPLGAGRIETRELEEEMRSSFLDYAMSVIVSRALPDARDGLKPVHRRVLYAMNELGLQPGRPRIKCARVVGDTMGKYHPHGNQAIYDALVRMAQTFSLRYPLVDPQGNFGNVDGYPAAAERYTECRLSAMAMELLRDIDQDTIDYEPNYDGTARQPSVLPARFPNLLVNGSSGIAVGMATNIAPHNLGEVVDAIVTLIDDPTADVDRLSRHLKGPDFPTGGIILGREGIREAYRSGRGRIVMRARAHIEELRGGRSAVVVTELPYGVKKGGDDGVIAKIADLVRDGVLTEIPNTASGVKDLSDKSGMRIQIELKRDAIPQVALNKLYKHTALQTTFGYNAVALVDGVPRTLSLLELIRHYLDHQREVVTRRLKYELRNAVRRAHVLEGYLIALDNIDAVIETIRGSASTDEARSALIEKFSLSEIQAQAILDMRLRALTGLERKRIQDEYADLQERIGELREILGDERRIDTVIREELVELKERFGKNDDRRTEIAVGEGSLELEDMIAEEDMVIAITRSGYIKRLPVTTYREQRRGGIGVMGMDMKDEDYIEHLFVASTHDYILFFTTVGKVYRLKVHELPLGSRQSKGRAIVNLLPLRQDELIRAVIATRDFKEAKYLVFATKKGIVKKTEFLEYNTTLKADGIIALRDARGRRADRRPALRRRRRHPHGLAHGADGAVLGKGRALDGEACLRRRGDEAPRGRRGDRGRHRLRRRRPPRRDRERMGQAHASLGLPREGPRHDGRQDRAARRGKGTPRGGTHRPRRLPGDAHLRRRDGDPDRGRRHQAVGPRNAGRHRDAPPRGRAGVEPRAGHRLRRGAGRGLGRGAGRRGARPRGRDRRARSAGLDGV